MKKFLFSLALLVPSSLAMAGSDNDLVNAARWYKVYWSGIHIADLRAQITDNNMYAAIESYGIVKKVSKYNSKTHTVFNYDGSKYVPSKFYTEFNRRHGNKKIDIKYEGLGQIKDENVTPPDNRAKRPAVKDEMKINAFDPLTAVLNARSKIKESLDSGQNSFSFNMYDGRRLSRLDFKINGRYTREISGIKYPIIEVAFKRFPVSGYTNNELERMKGEEPDFTLYISDDEEMLPIKADMEAPLGTAVLLLEKKCATLDECSS